ncbi:amiloride-sensitive sodium channel subunit gamma-like isoform X2 [Stylophora pistillata]|uniref:amiloride-sensitive sodium channel subunit gamma-like isoform X2 n=1 Tax=Stylophora pistillata TaxID=50429 RepID=UPI000C03BFEC|nr:amiloride-sensitive sodium channel subunit gamma-like isoform X2 [Stylophora pistillata]
MFVTNQRNEIRTGIETNQHESEIRIKNLQTDGPDTSDGNFEGLRSFAHVTTLHGARFLFSESFFRRLVWLGMIIACFGFCIYQTYSCLWQFSLYPFNTKMTTNFGKDDRQLPFPAVTLCNFNTFNTRLFRQIEKSYFNESQIERHIADIALMATRSDDVLGKDFRERNPWLLYRPKLANETNPFVLEFSHQMEDMLLPNGDLFYSCSINGKKCDANNFTSFLNPLYAKCYTFNAAKNGKLSQSALFAGKQSGFKLRLNIERESYLPNLVWSSVGIVILIHDQNSYPIVEEFGFVVPPGMSTTCAIRRRNITNLPHPYSTKCKEGTLEAFNGASQIAYSKQACLIKCRNKYTIKTCNCTPTKFKADPGVPFCAPIEEATCVYKSLEEFGNSDERKTCEKECPEPCNQIEYKTSISYSGLQRGALIQHLMSFLNGTEKSSVDRSIYEPLLNMTKAEREKYIEKLRRDFWSVLGNELPHSF